MYNGVEAQQMKGTGMSGYVQRSKATVRSQLSRFRPSDTGDGEMEGSPTETINPLLARRSQRENAELARRLESHLAIRAVRLRVHLYREERLASGVAAATVERECGELYKSLMSAALEEQAVLRKADEAKSAERFAAAFGVRSSAGGETFDRARQEESRRVAEEERRTLREHQLADRLKRVRQEAAAGHGHSAEPN